MDIEISDAARFFEMLSDGGTKCVTLETFVKGCIRMRGQALAMDLHDLRNKHENMTQNMERFMVQLDDRIRSLALKTDLAELRRTVTKGLSGTSFSSADSDASNRCVHVV